MDPSLSSGGKPISYVNVLMGREETDLLSAALDQFEETQHKESKQPVQEDGDVKSQVSQLTSGAHDGDGADGSDGGTHPGEDAFGSELAKLLKSDKEAKAVMMILGQLTHTMTSAAAAAAVGTQGPAQGTKTGTTTTGGGAPSPTTVRLNSLTLLQTERMDAKLGAKDVQLSCYSRGATDSERIKIRKQHCVALPHKFGVMKVAEILAPNSRVTIGSELLAQQITTDRFSELTIKVDAANVFWVPDITDFTNPAIVAAAPRNFLLKAPTMDTLVRYAPSNLRSFPSQTF
jgi:hypothetical protein